MATTDSLHRDLRLTLRRLASGRAFTLTALATLAVSIGAAVTVFSVTALYAAVSAAREYRISPPATCSIDGPR